MSYAYQATTSTAAREEKIATYMIPSLLAFICFFPVGVIALIYSTNVTNRLTKGDYKGARRASYLAKGWSFTILGIAGIWLTIHLVTFLFFYAELSK